MRSSGRDGASRPGVSRSSLLSTDWCSLLSQPRLLRVGKALGVICRASVTMGPFKAVCLLPLLFGFANAQLGLSHGFLNLTTSAFSVQLVKDSQTLFSLKPSGSSFDFIPGDKMSAREANGRYHLGDITYRARRVGSTAWISGDTSTSRRVLTPLQVSGNTLAAANLAPTLPSNSLLNITRRWVNNGGQLQLLFDVTNSQTSAVEIGSLGVPLEFNNVSINMVLAWPLLTDLTDLYRPYCH